MCEPNDEQFAELAAAAVSGGADAVQRFWLAVYPMCERIARRVVRTGLVHRSEVEDLSQELCAAIPDLLTRYTDRVSDTSRGLAAKGWFAKALHFSARNIIRTGQFQRKNSHEHQDEILQTFEPAASLAQMKCLRCGKEFVQHGADTVCCSAHCTKKLKVTRERILEAIKDCSLILELLRGDARLENLTFTPVRLSRRIALLRYIGYGITREGSEYRLGSSPLATHRLLAELRAAINNDEDNIDEVTLDDLIASNFFFSPDVELDCWNCGKAFTVNAANLKNHCSTKCQMSHWRQANVQVEPSCSHP